jgi:hypothetical protein
MNNDDISGIREELHALNARLLRESENTTHHIKEIHKRIIDTNERMGAIYDRIAFIHDFLWPVVHKLFPGFTEDARTIAALDKGSQTGPRKGG